MWVLQGVAETRTHDSTKLTRLIISHTATGDVLFMMRVKGCDLDSGCSMRTGQHNNNNNNKNRNRNRNRRHNNGGGNLGGGGGGGSGSNRVYDSNGPDVKLRGTAHTIAEKYMQLARDAQSSGDIVMAESYYQFSDHYYRIWLAAQPVGQPLQFSRRTAEEEFEDEDGEGQNEPEGEAENGDSSEAPEPVAAEGAPQDGQGEGDGQQGYQPRQNNNRDFRNNNNNRDNNNRNDGGNRNFRQRWPRRNERFNADGQPNGNGQDVQAENGERQDQPQRFERAAVEERVVAQEVAAPDAGNWEAPSFLTRPTPVIAADVADAGADEVPAPRRRGRPPKVVAPVEDAPQGD
jgi:Domain of unknown function (DUF4167)